MASHVVLEKRAPLTREESGTLFSQTMGLVAVTAGLFTAGAYVARNVSPGWSWVFFAGSVLALIGMSIAAQRSENLAVGLLFAFGLFIGAAISPTISYYARADPQALWQAGGATALFVAGFGAFGYATRRDLSKIARASFWALIVLILFGVVTILVNVPHGDVVYAVVGLVVFAGLTSYDFQRLRRTKDVRSAPLLAASIFLDILNVFLLLLSLAGRDNN
ncbi:MAG TPA: Bax inhibitor-1 family protein [Jatrophihabitans sp.]|nr:Bax inhibitor-1 family protein [Jatrophihabitans sp.]